MVIVTKDISAERKSRSQQENYSLLRFRPYYIRTNGFVGGGQRENLGRVHTFPSLSQPPFPLLLLWQAVTRRPSNPSLGAATRVDPDTTTTLPGIVSARIFPSYTIAHCTHLSLPHILNRKHTRTDALHGIGIATSLLVLFRSHTLMAAGITAWICREETSEVLETDMLERIASSASQYQYLHTHTFNESLTLSLAQMLLPNPPWLVAGMSSSPNPIL